MQPDLPTVEQIVERLLSFPPDAKVHWPIVLYGEGTVDVEDVTDVNQIKLMPVTNEVEAEIDA